VALNGFLKKLFLECGGNPDASGDTALDALTQTG
jgi:hypothetical protein